MNCPNALTRLGQFAYNQRSRQRAYPRLGVSGWVVPLTLPSRDLIFLDYIGNPIICQVSSTRFFCLRFLGRTAIICGNPFGLPVS